MQHSRIEISRNKKMNSIIGFIDR